jgi:hypothetical protein
MHVVESKSDGFHSENPTLTDLNFDKFFTSLVEYAEAARLRYVFDLQVT